MGVGRCNVAGGARTFNFYESSLGHGADFLATQAMCFFPFSYFHESIFGRKRYFANLLRVLPRVQQ